MANMNFGVNILPKANNTYTLGNSDYKWNIFANSLNGVSLSNIITDVQVNGTSILSNNIANIPLASTSAPGVVMINGYGLWMNPANGHVSTTKASTNQIKEGTQEYYPIVPYNLKDAVFYGLAKAAGDSTQSASSNAIGVYTDGAKTAIKNMLAVPKIDDNEDYDLNTTWSAKRLSSSTRIYSWIGSNFSGGIELPTPTIIANQKIDEQGNLVSDSNYNTYVYALTLNTMLIIYTRNNEEFIEGQYSSNSISSSNLYGDITITNGYDYIQIMAPYFAFSCEKTTVNNNNVIILYMGFTGVTNTDYATAEKAGVVKIDGNGLWINSSNGKVSITKASTANIKSGTVETYPIVPYNQHEAVFYGLAKAAGDSTQSASSNAIGTYTDSAKTAIQNMLGIPYSNATTSTHGLMSSEDKSKLDNIISIDPYVTLDTPTDIVEIENATAAAVKEIDITIAPLQDLHGYDHSWVGGAGKNLLEYSLDSWTVTGISFSNDGYDASFSGTATNNVTKGFGHFSITGSDRQLTFIVKDIESLPSDFNFYIWDNTTQTNASGHFTNFKQTFDAVAGHEYLVAVRIFSGVALSTPLKFKAMVLESTETDMSFEPYSNICPISGWTGANVTVRKKNLLPKFGSEWSTGSTETYFGVKTSDSTPSFPFTFLTSGTSSYTGVPVYVCECKPNTTYTIKPPTGMKPIVSEYASIEGVSNKSNALARWTDNTTGYSVAITKTTQTTAKYLVVSLTAYSASASVTVDENTQFQLEEGSTSTPFEAFATNYSITFPSTAGTVYGGTLTVNQDGTGSLVVDRAIHDFGDFTYTYDSSYTRFVSSTVSGQEIPAAVRIGQGVCSCYQVLTHGEAITDVPDGSIYNGATGGNPVVFVHDSRYTDPTEFKTALTGQKFVFKFATASTYTLTTDQVVHLLSGQNTVYADCGDIQKLVYAKEISGLLSASDKSKLDNIQEGAAVKDVQINGTSILNNKIANIPIATWNTLGVVKPNPDYGIGYLNNGTLFISIATDTLIKAGENTYKPIVPSNQHKSIFYGLAKAAGDTTQSASSNTIGNYTDSARIAIQKMLGIYSAPWEFINEETFTNAEEADYTITTDSNDQAFELTDVLLMFETPQQETEAIKGAYGQVRFYHTSSSYFSSESGQWTQAANGAAHGFMVMIEQEPGGLFICRETASTTTSNSAAWRTRYGTGFGDSASQGLKMLSTPRIISKIIITKVTGTGHYKLYGKRQATT